MTSVSLLLITITCGKNKTDLITGWEGSERHNGGYNYNCVSWTLSGTLKP